MAIIYTYPNLPLSSLSADDLLVITNVDATNNNPTKSVTLADIATYVTGTGSGTGTTNKIVKFTDGANGLLGDSIMTESTGLIDLAGQFVSTSSPTLTQAAPVSGIKAILNGTTAAPNVALYGESKNTGSTQADSNYGLYAKGEFEGTGGFTGFVIGGNLEGRYDGTGANGANATIYGSYNLARATTAANGTVSYMIGANNLAKVEGTNVVATNLQATHSTVELSNGTAGDVIVQILDFDTTGGGTVTGDLSYLQIQNDTMPTVAGTKRAINSKSVLPSLFTGQVEIPLVPTINAHATSKQYVDQQISSVVSGLVFISTWDASSTPGGSPDLTDASTQVVGHYYVVSVAGSATPNGAGTLPNSWNVGDWCIYVEQGATDRWEKLDQTFVSGAGAAGQVTFWNSQNEVAGDNNFFWDNTNKRLGLGITSPITKLHAIGRIVGGTTGFTSNMLGFTGLGSYNSSTAVENIDALYLRKGGTNGSSVSISLASASGDSYFVGARIKHLRTGSNSDGGLVFETKGDNSINTTSERMRIDPAGDIFISPRATAASSGSGILYFKNVDDNSATINGGSIRTVDSVNNPSGADMRFQVADDNGTLFDTFSITSTGFVGIGTTAPDYPLDVSSFGAIRISNSASNSVQLIIDNSNTTDAGTETSEIRFRHYRSYVAGQNDAGSIIVGKEEPWDAAGDRNSYMSFSTRTGTSGATEKMRITSTGNVGIGTTSPTDTLTISNDNNLLLGLDSPVGNDAQLRFYSAGSYKNIIYRPANSNDLRFNTSTSGDVLTIQQDGNVGIGTSSPNHALDIEKNTSSLLNLYRPNSSAAASSKIDFSFNTANATEAVYARIRSDVEVNTDSAQGGDLSFHTANAGTVGEVMRITQEGIVGIGTTNPQSGFKLDVNGNVITRGSTYVLNDLIHYDSSDFNINASNGSTAIKFETGSSERMRITSAGDVLLGTTAEPNGTSVYGSSFTSLSHDRMALKLASSLSTSIELVAFYNPNGKVGSITTNGSATAFNTSSDYRLKEDLKDFDGLDKVSKIPVYNFKWKVDDSRSYGVLAHELQEVVPNAVNGEKDADEMQGVDYSKVVPLLIKSIQELEAKVKILENK